MMLLVSLGLSVDVTVSRLDPKVLERPPVALRDDGEKPVGVRASVCGDQEVDQEPFGLAACRCGAPCGVHLA